MKISNQMHLFPFAIPSRKSTKQKKIRLKLKSLGKKVELWDLINGKRREVIHLKKGGDRESERKT
jgi:hypothetical protein